MGNYCFPDQKGQRQLTCCFCSEPFPTLLPEVWLRSWEEEEAPFCNHKHKRHPEQEDRRSLGQDLLPAYLQTFCVGKVHCFLGFLFHSGRCNCSLIHGPEMLAGQYKLPISRPARRERVGTEGNEE